MTTSGHQSVLLERRSWVLLALSLVGLVGGMYRRPRKDDLDSWDVCYYRRALTIVALVSLDRWYGMRYTASALPAFLLARGCRNCCSRETGGQAAGS